MIQITAQMRVLVAIEPVDGRNYVPSIVMWSRSFGRAKSGRFKERGRHIIQELPFGPQHGQQLIRWPELPTPDARRNQRRHGFQLLGRICP